MRGPATAELLADLQRFSLQEGEFTLASGRQSKWYLDARQVTYRGDCLETVGRAVLEAVENLAFDAVGGLTLGADPVALAVAACSGKRAFAVRKEAKGHGAGGRMAGPIKEGDRVLVVDDAVTSGGSTLQALDAIDEFGGVVVGAACLLERATAGPQEAEPSSPMNGADAISPARIVEARRR